MTWEINGQIENGHLVTIGSGLENEFIRELLQTEHGINAFSELFIWIGGQQDNFGNWGWVTGEPWNYENWSAGEPNNLPDEDCLSAYTPLDGRYGQWNDYECDGDSDSAAGSQVDVLSYICECGIDEQPIPTLGHWGLIILVISLIVAGSVVLRHRIFQMKYE